MAKILIVDDERSIRLTLSEFLRAAGHTVETAEDVPRAQELLRETMYDVVITDILMPRIGGVALLQQIRAESPDSLVLMITGDPAVETAVEAVRAGAYDYLTKPVSKDTIVRVVGRAAQVRQLQEDKRRLEAANREYQADLERLVRERTEALRQAEARYRSLVETTPDWVWEVDAHWCYTYVSPRVLDLIGYTPEEVLGRPVFDFVQEEEAARIREQLESSQATAQPVTLLERNLRHKSGEVVVVETSASPVLAADGSVSGYRGMDRNVTSRKRIEEQVRKLARTVDQSPAAIMITDFTGKIEFVNPKFTRVSGYSAEEVLGCNPRVLKSGETDPGEYQRLWNTVLAGRDWRGEFRNRRKDGSLYWEAATISPLRDDRGRITHFIAVKEDITELRLTESKFLRAQRLEGIGSLAGGIAHDLNNILTPILMCAPGLHLETNPNLQKEREKTITDSAQRAVGVVRQLLSFARGRDGRKHSLELRHLINEMTRLARETFPRSITIDEFCPKDLWPVVGDATRLHQILLNLCLNARDAMPTGGRLSVRAANITLAEPSDHLTLPPGRYVRFQVEDTGTGIAEEHKPRIFEIFFTTKAEGLGSGLGLSTVFNIVREHGGDVQFDSALGKGTVFTVLLPAAAEVAALPGPDPDLPPAPRGHDELILVVDDEPSVLSTLRMTIELHGYRALTANDGSEALALFARHRQDIRAAVVDYLMPGLDGLGLCRALRRVSPATALIVSSGALANPERVGVAKAFQDIGIRHLLNKPHSGEALLHALAEALSLPPTPTPPPENAS